MKKVTAQVLEKTKTYEKPVRVQDLQSCKRLFTRVLTQIQLGEIPESRARLLIYGLSQFISLFKEFEFEERLEALEGQVKQLDGLSGLGGLGK